MVVRGIIFDLDGTLIDSGLDFNAMRREMGLPRGQTILEGLAELPDGPQKQKNLAILREHELAGADRATLMPGVRDLLAELTRGRFLTGVLTRNSREATQRALDRLGLTFTTVLTREDAAPKPNGEGLLRICKEWGVTVDEVVFIGDFELDLEAGRAAGIRTGLYVPAGETPPYLHRADFVIRDFRESLDLIGVVDR